MLGGYTFDYIAKMAAEVVSMREELNSISIVSAPTADVEEIRHAKWNEGEGEVHYCSNCSMDALIDGYLTDYCPWCGAKMDL